METEVESELASLIPEIEETPVETVEPEVEPVAEPVVEPVAEPVAEANEDVEALGVSGFETNDGPEIEVIETKKDVADGTQCTSPETENEEVVN